MRHLAVHRRVRALVRDQVPANRRPVVLARALRLLATATPGDPDTPATWPAYADLVPHVHAATRRLETRTVPDPPGFRRLLLGTCRYLEVSGQYRQARDLTEQTLERWRAGLGDDHPDTLTSASRLAAILHRLGERGAARQLCADTLARRRAVLGDDHPDTLRSAHNLATNLHDLGDYQAARKLREETLARFRRVLGDDHAETTRTANNLRQLSQP